MDKKTVSLYPMDLIFFYDLGVYKDEPKPEYAPKTKSVNKPPAARPPIVATIQRGIRPISLISIIIKD